MRTTISRRKAVYLALILLLSLILLYQNLSGGGSPPRLEEIEADVETVEIDGPAASIRIVKSGERWLIGEEGYPADGERVEDLIEKIASITPLERVSTGDYLEPYGLDEAKAIEVTLGGAGGSLRRVFVGSASPTGRQSYLRLPDSDQVLLVSGNLRRDFEVDVEALRQREVLRIDPATIRRFSLFLPGTTEEPVDFLRTEEGWGLADGTRADQEAVNDYLRSFESLRADGFPEELADSGELLLHLSFETDDGPGFVELISRDAEGRFLARSSGSDYIFTLNRFAGERILKEPEELTAGDQ